MTFARDLLKQNREHLYKSSIAHQLARYALTLNYAMLPHDVVHEAKRCMLDSLGCAIGAYRGPGRPILEATVKKLGGSDEATVFGSGLRTNAQNATLVNTYLIAWLNFHDMGGSGQGHDSESLASILAIAEREKAKGRDLLTSYVIAYELGNRFGDAIRGLDYSWKTAIRCGLSVPPALGKLMGLNEEQIANAVGICASRSLPIGILDIASEETTMAKDLCFGFVAHDAILSCTLAKEGFTGPVRVVEGETGFSQAIFQGKLDLERLVDFNGWRILYTRFRKFLANSFIQGRIQATLAIINENNLKPDDIAAVRLKAGSWAINHTSSPLRRYPTNSEDANHSSYYVVAIAIKTRTVGPESFEPELFINLDPVVIGLIDKMTQEVDSSFADMSRGGISEITTKDGRQFQKRIDIHGNGNQGFAPLTDKELEDKFTGMTIKYLGKERVRKLLDTIWNVEKLNDISKLTKLMVFPSHSK
jgi:2-methylcitrate dehydratase